MKIPGWLPIRAVAEMLGVSEQRVRKLAESQLPTATNLGSRATAIHQGSVEALIARRRGQETSLSLVGMGPATRPAAKIVDTVMAYHSDWGGSAAAAVHVRVWQRHPDDGGQHLVVLGHLEDQVVALNQHLPEVVAELMRLLPAVTISGSVFLEYRPEHWSDRSQWLGVTNLIKKDTSRKDARPSDVYDDPGHPLRIDFTDLEQVLGDRFYVFAKGTYTVENVERWLRERARDHTTTQIDVVLDDWDVTGVVASSRALADYTEELGGRHGDDLLGSAASLTGHLTKARIEQRDQTPRPDRTRPETQRGDDDAQWPDPDRFATRVVQPDVSADDRAFLTDLAQRYEIQDDHLPTVLETIDHLGELQYEVDEYADFPDPVLHTALAEGILLMSHRATSLTGYDNLYRYPGPPWIPRGPYDVNGPRTRAYLDQLTDRRFGAPLTANERRLAAQLRKDVPTGTEEDKDQWFGTDPQGHRVAVVTARGIDRFAVEWPARIRGVEQPEWPARPNEDLMVPGARVVADAAQYDTPVLVLLPSQTLVPLPRTAATMEQLWSYGFDSSGPHDLAEHIATAMGYEHYSEARDVIGRMVRAADETGLDLPVNQIRAAAGDPTGR
ncbi:helix-turn-helix transcriptional regulator [Promicromonospora sp. NFX87]|uniref:helix-turn-helix transcriptional regulator n=1 Tax=Promicromonospora sp. NFX87 TaxID=3402691 RepID=UPI003AFB04DD